jgi:hypothetical protein
VNCSPQLETGISWRRSQHALGTLLDARDCRRIACDRHDGACAGAVRGALYAAQTTLDAKAKNIRVVMQNAGYQPLP